MKKETVSLETIGALELKNQGGFVVRLESYHKAAPYAVPKRSGCTEDIAFGQSVRLSLDGCSIREGELVTVRASVAAGKDNSARTWFTYKKNDPRTAKFNISGTPFDNELGFVGIV